MNLLFWKKRETEKFLKECLCCGQLIEESEAYSPDDNYHDDCGEVACVLRYDFLAAKGILKLVKALMDVYDGKPEFKELARKLIKKNKLMLYKEKVFVEREARKIIEKELK